MKSVPVMLLVAFAVGVQGQDLSPRTFAFFPSGFVDQQSHHNAHPHQHGSHAVQAQGHHNPVQSAHQPHVGHVHQVPTNVHPGHVVPEHHNGHEHVHNHLPSAATPALGNANTVPVLVCRVVHVPAPPSPPAPSSTGAGSVVPPAVLGNISSTLETVVGKVVDPVVSLLHNASVWLNRTGHRRPVHGNHVHQHQHHSSVSAVDTVHHKVLALKMHNNPTHQGSGHSPVTHATTTGAPDHSAVTTAITPSRVPAQTLTSTVGAPAPRLFTEPSLSPSPTPEAATTWTVVTFGASNSSTDGSTSTDVTPSVTTSVSEATSVASARAFTTQPPTTVSSAPSSTLAEALFELTPRAQSAASTPELCRLLTIRCEPRFRRRLCRLYEECLLSGARPRQCLEALTSVVSTDERCTRA
ncbi:uncharacterized protein LOC144174249 [Haemaphysalis longicornis]